MQYRHAVLGSWKYIQIYAIVSLSMVISYCDNIESWGLCWVSSHCYSLTWKDLMKVHRRVLIPSPLLSSLTNRITLNKRKKVMEMRALSSVFWSGRGKEWLRDRQTKGGTHCSTLRKTHTAHSFMQSVIHAFSQESCMGYISYQATQKKLKCLWKKKPPILDFRNSWRWQQQTSMQNNCVLDTMPLMDPEHSHTQ